MPFGDFALLVAVLAVLYSVIARVVQNKFIDRAAMKALQEESKTLQEEYKKASERKDQKRMDEFMKKQTDIFPRMNMLMMGQFKIMFVILGVFLLFNWSIQQLDPSIKDDISLEANDRGEGCDTLAGDGIFSGCASLSSEGVWVVHATAYNGEQMKAQNASAFIHVAPSPEEPLSSLYVPHPQPNILSSILPSIFPPAPPFSVETVSQSDGRMRFEARAPFAHKVRFSLDNTTRFFVDLPMPLPVIGVQRIYEVYWWFIFVLVFSGFAISILMSMYEKITIKKSE